MPPSSPWESVYRAFDPNQPVPIDHPEWHAQRTYDPLEGLRRKLALPENPHLLYLGTIGTGKSTELRRLAVEQSSQSFVLLLDLVEHFNRVVSNNAALQRVSAWEVCHLIGLALYQAAEERLSIQWPPDVLSDLEKAWRAAAGATATETPQQPLNMAKLAKAVLVGAGVLWGGPGAGVVTGAVLKAAETGTDALHWNLPIGRAKQALLDDTEASRDLRASVNRIIGEINLRHQRVVLIIDGLDRIQEVERVKQIFIDTDILSRLHCRVVLCGPFLLRHDPRVNTVLGFEPVLHVNEPVLRQEDPKQPGNGVAFCHDLYNKRARDLGARALISDEDLLHLAYYSGGRARDFVRLVRGVAEHALARGVERADRAIVDAAIDDARRLLEMGLNRAHIEVLRSVMADPQHRCPEGSALVWELLNTWRLLPYPNRSEWFYPHPLLTLELVRLA